MHKSSGVLVCLIALAGPVLAQDYRATLLGQVSDPTGAAVPGTKIRATKVDTNVSKETETTTAGVYTIPGLEPGTYNVVFTKEGFQTVNRQGIELRVGDKLNLTVTMQVGQITQEVTVVGEQELVQTATASRGLVFDPIKVQELPLNGRQSFMLMRFTPGVTFNQRQFGSSGFSGTRAWDVNGSFTMNGGREGTNQFLLNGAPISTNGTFNVAPNVEAIQEFKVMVNTYDAQYARTGGGNVSTTLKSGTNEWHGSVFDFWRNRILDANTRQNNASGQRRGFRNQHQFGGVVGGPIRRDKDFVFFSFEGFRERVPFPSVATVPPSEIRNGNFNLAPTGQSSTILVFDPQTSRVCGGAVSCPAGSIYVRDAFPGNIIPLSRQSPVGRAILSYYPAPNFNPQALSQNFVRGDNVGKYRYEQPMARWDHIINDNQRFNFTFTFQDGSEFRNSNGFDPPAQNGNMPGTVRRDMNYILSYDWTISPTRILHWQGSYNRFVENFPDVSDPSFTYDKLGIKSMPQVDTFVTRIAPRVNVSGYNNMFGNNFVNQSSRQQANAQIYLAETRSRHSLKYGFEWAKIMRHNRAAGRASGEFSFDNIWSRQYFGRRNPGILDGNGVADTLLGLPNSGFIAYNDTFFRREPYVGFYIQDDWKVSNRLTLNLGLRYDFQFGLTESHNRLVAGFAYDEVNTELNNTALRTWQANAAADPNYPRPPQTIKGGLQFAGVKGVPRTIYDIDWSNIQPRIGVAYQFLPKTVMRGGVGIFHRTATQGSLATGYSLNTDYVNSIDGGLTHRAGLTGPYSMENPFPDGVVRPLGNSLGINTNLGGQVTFDGRKRPIPRTFQWSYTLEREFGWNMVLEVSYVGSYTNKEPRTIQLSDMGKADYEAAFRNPAFYQAQVPNPWFGVIPRNRPLGAAATIARRDLLRRIPQFNDVQSFINPWGTVYYHGLQTRFEKRMFGDRSRGGALTWILSYTWSKQMETTNRQQFNFEWFEDWLGKTVTANDRTHNFQYVGIWDLPVGKGRSYLNGMNKLGEGVLGGWNVNWTIGYTSGFPLGAWTGWEYLCGNPSNIQQSESQWVDRTRSCFRQLQPFEQVQLMPRFHQIRSHTKPQIDLAIAKKFNFGERWQLEFRGEGFNAFNTPLRGDPPLGNPSDGNFGILPVQQLNFPRNIQLGMRLRF
jgi:hypothetical protein